jgi:hypothetical protein
VEPDKTQETSDAVEAQAYDHGYHDGWDRRGRQDETPALTEFGDGYKEGYAAGFKSGVEFGLGLRITVGDKPVVGG